MRKAVLLYDSECSFCTRFQKALTKIDLNKELDYRSIYDQSVYVDFPQISQEDCQGIVHLVDPEGNVYRGVEVIDYIARILPGVSKFAWLLDNESAQKAMKTFYSKLNDMRIMKKRKCYSCGPAKKKR